MTVEMEEWLEAKLAATPEPLRTRLRDRLADLVPPDLQPPEALLEAGCRVLEGLRGRLHLRESALDLLVADGLFTLACEAVADSDPEHVTERCRQMGPGGRLGELAARWERGIAER